MKAKNYIWLSILLISLGCSNDDGAKLPSVEDRVNAAVEELRETLVEPANGWRLDYRPTSQTGTYLILLDFNTDGTVRLQSDVTANSGEFRDQVIAYRIDSSQGIELIMETYSVFHYLFELQQASFGGEFEFIFEGDEGDNLNFKSKTDAGSDVTSLLFVPATSADDDLISTVSAKTLSQGHFQSENLGGIGSFGIFNFHLLDQDFTLSATFDLQKRTIKLLGIAEGSDMSSVISNDNISEINVETGFSFQNEQIILDQSINVSFNGNTFEIQEIPVGEALRFQESFCTGQQDSVTRFSAIGTDLGAYEANSSLFQVANGFKASANDVFAINHIFLYDEDDNSIEDQIENVFPDIVEYN